MLTRLAARILAAVSLAAAPAAAQSPLLEELLQAPAEAPPTLTIALATLTLDEAAVLREALADDVLVLIRIHALQERLLVVNAQRNAIGAPLLVLPAAICTASPLGELCADLASTFEQAEENP